jgi:hypothetical protein
VLGTTGASGHPRLLRRLGRTARRAGALVPRPCASRRRPWWKWLLIALLLAATLAVTAVYAATLAKDIARQHWADAVDASREAVLMVVGWVALVIVATGEDNRDADQPEQAGDRARATERQDESTPAADSVLRAQDRVRRLRTRLAELDAVRERAGTGADPDLDREVATTVARLELARQWLTSAQSARTASGTDHEPTRRPADDARARASLSVADRILRRLPCRQPADRRSPARSAGRSAPGPLAPFRWP